ncbi:unnamed protein product [Gordionus sp. m RMFG-2023]
MDYTLKLDSSSTLKWAFDSEIIWFELILKGSNMMMKNYSLNFRANDLIEDGDQIYISIAKDGTVYLEDRHIVNRMTIKDPSQDYRYYSKLSLDKISIHFSRNIYTCDANDIIFTNDTLYLVWKQEVNMPIFSLHNHVLPVYLFHHTPNSVKSQETQEENTIEKVQFTLDLSDIFKSNNYSSGSNYLCQLFRLPSLTSRHHIIKHKLLGNLFANHKIGSDEEIIQNSLKHVGLHGCQPDLQGHFYTDTSYLCYQSTFPPNLFSCNEMISGWVKGGEKDFYWPPEAGYSIGAPGDSKYVLLEVLFDDTIIKNKHIVSSALKRFVSFQITYTPKLRENNAGVLATGLEPSQLYFIPTLGITLYGHCDSHCTSQNIPLTGINIYGIQYYTHGNVDNISTMRRSIGSNTANIIMADHNYRVDYQSFRYLKKGIILNKGDQITLTCNYGSSISLHGFYQMGLFWEQMSCMQFLTEPIMSDIREFGTKNDSKNLFDINNKLFENTRAKLIEFYKQGNLVTLCRNINRNPIQNTERFVNYPNIEYIMSDYPRNEGSCFEKNNTGKARDRISKSLQEPNQYGLISKRYSNQTNDSLAINDLKIFSNLGEFKYEKDYKDIKNKVERKGEINSNKTSISLINLTLKFIVLLCFHLNYF